jgi:glycosyltransferase involved in cell wall biosynthesis
MKRENSGLARTTLELAKFEEEAGHNVCVQEPQGATLYGHARTPDMHTIHSQLNPESYYDNKPKFLFAHGEPLSSVGNGVSMKAVVDLACKSDAFICMRRDELPVWSSIKRTYLVPKGIDLDFYHPINGSEKLEGEPSVLYVENWRGQRNPLYLCLAMQEVWEKYPKARLHLYNCNDQKMKDTFQALIKNNKWWTFIKTLQGGVPMADMPALYNKADIVVSCLFPLYARSIEAFACGTAFIGPGYKENDYPFQCELDPHSIAETIIRCHENYDLVNYRDFAEKHHDVRDTVKQCVSIYERYL